MLRSSLMTSAAAFGEAFGAWVKRVGHLAALVYVQLSTPWLLAWVLLGALVLDALGVPLALGQACAFLSPLHPPLLSSLCALVPLLLLIFHRGCIISVIPLWTLQVLWLGFLIFICFPSRISHLVLGCNFLEQAPKPQPLDQAPCLLPT